MAASVPAFLQGSHFWSLSTCSQSVFQFGRQPWKAVGAASGLALGLSLTVSKIPVLGEKKVILEKAVMDVSRETPFLSTSKNYLIPFASISLAPLENSVEPKTGVEFPGASSEGKQLTGIGLRKKSVLGLKNIIVYAYGLYADRDSLKSSLGVKYDSRIPSATNKEELFEDVISSDVEVTVRLVIVYGRLKIGTIRSAFEESVGKGLKKFSGDDNKELLGRHFVLRNKHIVVIRMDVGNVVPNHWFSNYCSHKYRTSPTAFSMSIASFTSNRMIILPLVKKISADGWIAPRMLFEFLKFRRFTNLFTDDWKLPKGTTIDISRLPGQILQTKIDGQVIGSIQSHLLCQALFDLYIGEDAFDKSAKETMGLSLTSILCS